MHKWKTVAPRTLRMQVPGGWLYYVGDVLYRDRDTQKEHPEPSPCRDQALALTFVPAPDDVP